jgi:hypothetical protein
VRPVFFVFYAVMTTWLLTAAILRAVSLFSSGGSLDPLVVVTCGFGLVGLVVLVPTIVKGRRGNRSQAPEGQGRPSGTSRRGRINRRPY